MREWQKQIIRDIYDPVDKRGLRRIRRVLLTMARKNAKTTLIAALVLVHLVGPESGQQQQIYSAANDREQAAIIYRACEAMVLMDDDLAMMIKPVPSRKRLVCHFNGSFYQALSSDAKTKHGMNPAVWIYDELAQALNQDLYDALDTSQGTQLEPLGIVISTQARDPLSLMSVLVDDARKQLQGVGVPDPTLAAFVFEVPADADPFDESLWHLANPALGDFLSIEDMRAEAAKAKRLPSMLSRFRNLRLNQQVDGVDQIFVPEDWKACGMPVNRAALKGSLCYGGLDLSAKRDLTALVLVFPGPITSVLVRCWTPEHELDFRADRDRAPYRQWIDEGHLIAVPGKSIDYDYVAQEIAALASEFQIGAIAYDAWNMHNMKRALVNQGVSHWIEKEDEDPQDPTCTKFVNWRQGMRTMSPALETTELAVVEHRVAHGMHPVLRWAASNAVAIGDAAGNRMPAKHKARNRIDPLVAMVMAFGVAAIAPPPEDTSSIFDDLEKLQEAMDTKPPPAPGQKVPKPAPEAKDEDEEYDPRWRSL